MCAALAETIRLQWTEKCEEKRRPSPLAMWAVYIL